MHRPQGRPKGRMSEKASSNASRQASGPHARAPVLTASFLFREKEREQSEVKRV